MEEKKKTSAGTWIILILIVLAGLIFVLPSLSGGSIATKWTLMVCDEVMPNGLECYSVRRTQELWSKEACFVSGRATQNSNPVFECGKSCKYDGNFWVCEEICNIRGECKWYLISYIRNHIPYCDILGY